ncbi:MAG TPA: response regulator [Caulobacteraceae bacterium]|nr:response regulator [Caulobacteraceae bacterium]
MTPTTIERSGRPAELLLVEDNYGDVLLTKEALRMAKLRNRLAVASDGEEAMRMLRRESVYADMPRPDLVLLDLNLPRMDGREVLQAVKSNPSLQTIPVVVLTSSKAEIDILKSYQLHANGYIVKPVDMDQLQQIVRSIESFWFSVVVLADADTCGIEASHA